MLKLTFHIRRKKFYYVVSIYIPTILITILSWVSFWIPRSSPPARVALGITTVLALTTLIFGIQASMPKVSYVKAIDWFLCVSFLYVFAALVEYPSSTFVKSQAKKLSRKGTNILRKVKGLKEDSEDSFPLSSSRYGSTDKSKVGTMQSMSFHVPWVVTGSSLPSHIAQWSETLDESTKGNFAYVRKLHPYLGRARANPATGI